MNETPTFTVAQRAFAVHQLAARLQDNQGQRLTSALCNGLINEMMAALPQAAEPSPAPEPAAPSAPQAVLGRRRTKLQP